MRPSVEFPRPLVTTCYLLLMKSNMMMMMMIVEAADSGGRQTWNLASKPSWRSVPNNTELDLPGWTPRTLQTGPRPRQPVVNVVHHQPPQHAAVPHHRQYPHPRSIRHIEEPPAWYGSLRSATEPKFSDRKVRFSVFFFTFRVF